MKTAKYLLRNLGVKSGGGRVKKGRGKEYSRNSIVVGLLSKIPWAFCLRPGGGGRARPQIIFPKNSLIFWVLFLVLLSILDSEILTSPGDIYWKKYRKMVCYINGTFHFNIKKLRVLGGNLSCISDVYAGGIKVNITGGFLYTVLIQLARDPVFWI